MTKHKEEKGVALLFAILLTSALLLVALGISNVAYKEISFSLEARDSGKAFFAADTGIECALWFDKLGVINGNNTGAYDCGGNTTSMSNNQANIYRMVLDLDETCAEVTATVDPTAKEITVVSLGYNTSYDRLLDRCDSDLSSRTVIRAIRVVYPI